MAVARHQSVRHRLALLCLCAILSSSSTTVWAQDHLPLSVGSAVSPAWASGEPGLPDGSSGSCTCESPCDLNTISFEDLGRLLAPLNLRKEGNERGDAAAYKRLVERRPICNPMELATTKKIWVAPGHLPKLKKPAPGYLLVALWGCGGNQGLYGTVGGRGGCCPVTASSLYCGLKNYFGDPDLQKVSYTHDQYAPECTIVPPYTKQNPPPWCYVHDKQITFDEIRGVVERLIARGVGETWEDREISALIDRVDLPDQRNGGNGNRMIDEAEFLRFMGTTHLGGLPRRSFVREPWERTNASSVKHEELRKCSFHYGEDYCNGNNEVNEFKYDIDEDAEELKRHPDCLLSYQYGAYNQVKSGEVWCENSTWYPRSQRRGKRTRCRCYPPPLDQIPTDTGLFPGCPGSLHRCLTPPNWDTDS
jgi:hypothetical protein